MMEPKEKIAAMIVLGLMAMVSAIFKLDNAITLGVLSLLGAIIALPPIGKAIRNLLK